MRKFEILGLTHSEIDHEGRAIILDVDRTKSGKSRVIPLIPHLYHAVCQHNREMFQHTFYKDSKFLFPSRGKHEHVVEVKGFFKRACIRRAGNAIS